METQIFPKKSAKKGGFFTKDANWTTEMNSESSSPKKADPAPSTSNYFPERFDSNPAAEKEEDSKSEEVIPQTPSPPKSYTVKTQSSMENRGIKRQMNDSFDELRKKTTFDFQKHINKLKDEDSFKQKSFVSSPSIMNSDADYEIRTRATLSLFQKRKSEGNSKVDDAKPNVDDNSDKKKEDPPIEVKPTENAPEPPKSPEKPNNNSPEVPVVTPYEVNPEFSSKNLKLIETMENQRSNIKLILGDLKKINEKVSTFRRQLAHINQSA